MTGAPVDTVAAPGQPPHPMSQRITIYTDGGCRPNPGPGGWGAVLELPEGRRELSGSDPDSTNNRMELTAALRALEALPPGSEVSLVTDSTYLEQGITRWLAGWKRKQWVTSTGDPVKNRDLWMALDAAARAHRIRWSWARGHAGHAGNERAHQLAAAAIPSRAAAAAALGRGGPAATVPHRASATPGGGSLAPVPPVSRVAPAAPVMSLREALAAEHETVEAIVAVAWSGTRRVATWGAVLRHRGAETELAGELAVASANAAHVASASVVLESIATPGPVRLVTVSDYLRDGATSWLPGWRERGWRTRDGQPVANREAWERLGRQLARLPVSWEVVGDGAVPPEIERARALARAALAG